MLEVTLELEGKMSTAEIEAHMAEHLPGVVYYTDFKKGKKLIILEIDECQDTLIT